MSRSEFRGRVEGPRPPSAWLMSLVAAATLWLTEQLPLWLVAVQIAAFAFSFVTRRRPPAFQSDPVWLNVLMFGVTTATIRSALAGNPATVSLAWFTSLAQGLQLLDARPRKSEFVLVALALFQVVLASNLTDSVFFPPLVLVFLVAVTWTLLIHTLAHEAAEAGDPAAAERALAPDLRRLTLVATSACVLLAIALFVALPRLKTSAFSGGIGRGLTLSGFSQTVALGEGGRIERDPTVVLRVEAVEGELPQPIDAYWRGLAFDAFDGRSWSISVSERTGPRVPLSGVGRFGIELAARPTTTAAQGDAGAGAASEASVEAEAGASASRPIVAQRILREALDAEVLFTAGEPLRIEGPFQRLERDPNGGLYVPGHGEERLRYTIWTDARPRDVARLRRDQARPPREPGPGGPRPAARYLALPPLDARLRERAATIVAGAKSDVDRALRIEAALRQQGRYTAAPPPLGDAETSPIEAFLLGDLAGHCEYFASAMVVLARLEGLPARLVNGFAGGRANEVGGFLEVSQADAHAWVEIHFEDAGWVRFDPTPPDLRLRSEAALSLAERIAQVASALELWWFQRVVDYDSADQIGALRGLWRRLAPKRLDSASDVPTAAPTTLPEWLGRWKSIDLRPVWSVGALALAALLVLRHRRRARAEAGIPETYRRAQRILARRGLERAANVSARDFARCVADVLPEPGARAFESITEAYLAERFGQRPAAAREAELATLRDAVDGMRLRNDAHVR